MCACVFLCVDGYGGWVVGDLNCVHGRQHPPSSITQSHTHFFIHAHKQPHDNDDDTTIHTALLSHLKEGLAPLGVRVRVVPSSLSPSSSESACLRGGLGPFMYQQTLISIDQPTTLSSHTHLLLLFLSDGGRRRWRAGDLVAGVGGGGGGDGTGGYFF